MRIHDGLIKCVGFVSKRDDPTRYAGTAFIVDVPVDEKYGVLHLVTAKHVAIGLGESCLITMNGVSGDLISATTGDAPWFYHPTDPDSIDVAVLPFASDIIREYDINPIPVGIFATDERIAEYDIGVGDEVFTVGLFTQFYGTTRLSPIVRTGNIAMMPRDRVPTRYFGDVDMYLIEGRSIGGLSGSPVFCRNTLNLMLPTGRKEGEVKPLAGVSQPHLLGLAHGHWNQPVEIPEAQKLEAVNMGIAMVIPAKNIWEILYSPELIEMREKFCTRIIP